GRSQQSRTAAADDRGMDAGGDRQHDRIRSASVPGGRLMAVVASARASSWRQRIERTGVVLLGVMALAAACGADIASAQAPLQFPQRPPNHNTATPPSRDDKSPMLVQATEIHYDYTNKRVSAVGNVQIYHNGTTVEADRVIYDETTKRVQAEGN